MTVTFFGNRDTPQEIRPRLRAMLLSLIERGADEFFVGNHGGFDRMVRAELCALQRQFPHIRYTVVLAYMPTKADGDMSQTVLPEMPPKLPRRLAILCRNQWMLDRADAVVVYAYRPGGAAVFREKAIRQKKCVWDLTE